MNVPRKRDQLLSLKYSTIEASFSVPMLTLTLGHMAFAIGFAAKALGWGTAAIGLMAAAPHLCNFVQPPIMGWLRKRFSLYQIMVLTFTLNAMPWAFVSLLPLLGEEKHLVFGIIMFVASLANSVCGVAWSAAISDLVPLGMRGKFFGRRNLIFGTWTLIVVLVAGHLVDASHNSLVVFGVIFSVAAMMRMLGLFFLTRMKFSPEVMEVRPQPSVLKHYLTPFRDRNYLPLLLFVGVWGLCSSLGAPFYNVYVLRELPLSLGDLATLTMLASFGGLASLKTWGALSDRFGNKPVLFTSAMIWAGTALFSWLFASPAHYAHLYLNYFIVGFMTAGFQICQFNLMLKLAPAENKAQYFSVFFSFTSLLAALGPLLGGKILSWLPTEVGTLFGERILNYHLLFVGSLLLCFLSVHLLQILREPAERPLGELVRVMRGMREFNPLLGLASFAEVLFTPSELTRAARRSIRSLRKQTDAVSDVGEELVEEGWRVFKETFDKRSESGSKTRSQTDNPEKDFDKM